MEGLRADERIRQNGPAAGSVPHSRRPGVNARDTLPKLIEHGRDRLDRYDLCAGGEEIPS